MSKAQFPLCLVRAGLTGAEDSAESLQSAVASFRAAGSPRADPRSQVWSRSPRCFPEGPATVNRSAEPARRVQIALEGSIGFRGALPNGRWRRTTENKRRAAMRSTPRVAVGGRAGGRRRAPRAEASDLGASSSGLGPQPPDVVSDACSPLEQADSSSGVPGSMFAASHAAGQSSSNMPDRRSLARSSHARVIRRIEVSS